MANVIFTLSAKGGDKREILARFYHNQINQRAKSGVIVHKEYWDDTQQTINLPRIRVLSQEQAQIVRELKEAQRQLLELRSFILERFLEVGSNNSNPSKSWLSNVVKEFHSGGVEDNLGFFAQWDRFTCSRQVSKQRQAMYSVTKSMLQRYELVRREQNPNFELSFNTITSDLLADFENFLRTEYIFMSGRTLIFIRARKRSTYLNNVGKTRSLTEYQYCALLFYGRKITDSQLMTHSPNIA